MKYSIHALKWNMVSHVIYYIVSSACFNWNSFRRWTKILSNVFSTSFLNILMQVSSLTLHCKSNAGKENWIKHHRQKQPKCLWSIMPLEVHWPLSPGQARPVIYSLLSYMKVISILFLSLFSVLSLSEWVYWTSC